MFTKTLTYTVHQSVRHDATWESAVVIQGPHYGEATRLVIEQFKTKNENSLLIISTYDGGPSISTWENELVESGKAVYIFTTRPDPENISFWETNFANQNLQRLTSYVGLKHAQSLGIRHCLKIRSDVFLGKSDVMSYLINQLATFPLYLRDHESIPMRGRIVVSSKSTITDPIKKLEFAPFHIRDHWYFGFTQDLLAFFDIASPTWNQGSGIGRVSPESALTVVWMRDLKIQVADIDELLGRFFVVEDFETMEQCRTHAPPGGEIWIADMGEYKQRGIAYVTEFINKLESPNISTTHEQWKKMFDKECHSNQQ